MPSHRSAIVALLGSALALAGARAGADVSPAELRERCGAPSSGETTLDHGDFRAGRYTPEEMTAHFDGVYHGGARLPGRARWNEERDRLELVLERPAGPRAVPISLGFVANVTAHIEQGIRLGYFEHLFFADLGHAHLLVWRPFHESGIRDLPPTELALAYERILAHPRTRFLYHAAERLLMTDVDHRVLADRYLGWRFFTRNLVGANHPGNLLVREAIETPGNTFRGTGEEYYWWGAGFSLSASHAGCFPFRDGERTRYFDISLESLPSPPELLVPLVMLAADGA